MTEFIFRGEWQYGISTASIVLDDGGEVRCQAWMPFESFSLQPQETKSRLLGAVIDKLLSFSGGVASVLLGGTPAKAAAGIRRMSAFGDLGGTEDLHLAVVKASLRPDENEDAALSSMEFLSQQAGTVATWLRGHLKDTKWEVVTNGTGRIVVSGLVCGYCPKVEDCSFGFDFDAVGGFVVCRGALSNAVPEAKLSDVQALLLRYGFRSNFSIGALAFDNDRKVQYSASIPLFALRADPKGAIRRLSNNVLITLLELSDAVMRVCRDGQKPEKALDDAAFPRDVARLLQDSDAEDLDIDATSEEEELIESWFDAIGIRCTRGIETELTVYYRNKDNVGQDLQECFVMHGDMVLVQCRLDLEIPEGRREAVNDFALKYNASHPVVSLHMGYGADPGDSIYFQCLMPVSMLQARKLNSAAKERFSRILDRVHRYALEMTPKIQEIVRGQGVSGTRQSD
jgi:hypothetical protein